MSRRVILRVGRRAALVMIGAAFAIQIVRPARTNPPTDPARTLTAVARLPAGPHDVLVRGCQDCHSNDTRWPWYSNVAPISWFVIDHVNHGRKHFNYSDWAQYDRDRDRIPGLLKDICELTRKGDMPMSSYLWLHPDSRLRPNHDLTRPGPSPRQGRTLPIAGTILRCQRRLFAPAGSCI